MVSKESMTDPAMELLEKHKTALEAKLCQVKKDVNSVLDQVQKEDAAKRHVSDKLVK